jgi:hypothetical protein
VKVSQWAWPFIWGYAQHERGRLVPAFWRDVTISRQHAETLTKLELHLPLHNARHHWAVAHLRAGVPLELVRRQLGHSTPVLTLKTYGAFVPSGEDRARWEGVVADDKRGVAMSKKQRAGIARPRPQPPHLADYPQVQALVPQQHPVSQHPVVQPQPFFFVILHLLRGH